MQSTETCIVDGCHTPPHARQRCRSHYRKAHYSGALSPLPADKSHHRLTDVDLASRTATCSICGPGSAIRYRENRGTRQCKAAADRRWLNRSRDPEKVRGAWLKARYGITPDDYEQLLESQNGGCGICGGQSSDGRRLAVDHDHETGMVRGLLCGECNMAIGLLGDDLPSIERAAGYLRLALKRDGDA